jgi:hypothetical protein
MNSPSTTGTSIFTELPSGLSSLTVRELNENPDLCEVLVEYSCLELELADWYSREPRRSSRGEFRSWITEGRTLFDRLDEIQKTARQHRQRQLSASMITDRS